MILQSCESRTLVGGMSCAGQTLPMHFVRRWVSPGDAQGSSVARCKPPSAASPLGRRAARGRGSPTLTYRSACPRPCCSLSRPDGTDSAKQWRPCTPARAAGFDGPGVSAARGVALAGSAVAPAIGALNYDALG